MSYNKYSEQQAVEPNNNNDSSPLLAKDYREKLIEAFKLVIDPEIHINIVDLGLMYKVDVSEDCKHVDIEFTLTTPGCPLADEIEESIINACKTVLPEAESKTNLVWTPMWNADFMSEDARLELGFPI